MDKANEHKQTQAVVGPGSTLRKARTDLHLSTEEAAAQLHLAPRQIVALETDDYVNLPQPTYVRGYLRSYALLLGLAPEPILEAYNEAIAGRKPPRLAHAGAEERAAQRDALTKWVSAGIAALVLALVYAWWQGRETEPSVQETAGVAQPAQGEAAEQLPPGTVAPAPVPLPPELKPQIAPQPAAPTAPPAIAARKPEAAPVAPVPPVPASQPQATVKPEPAKPVAPPATPAAATPAESAPVATQPAAEERRAKLVLQADIESWAEVRDARQTRLIYETIPAGRIVGLEGVPPFQVFLGNVDGVKVFYEGKPFDAARYKRGTTARFSVGTAQTGTP